MSACLHARTAPGDRRALARPAEYNRYDWKAIFKRNDADFYDLFGPTKTSRKGYGAGIGYHKTLIYDTPRKLDLDVDVTYYGDLERLPDYQNVAVDVRLHSLDPRPG